MAAARLRDGTFAFVNNNYQYVRIDRTGKELKSFRVPFDPIGGSLYFSVLPNGHVLLGQYSANKVTEVDREGKQIWEAKVQWPNMVTRTPNGNTLVASTNTMKVIELDRGGKTVREFRDQNLRPYIAYRRYPVGQTFLSALLGAGQTGMSAPPACETQVTQPAATNAGYRGVNNTMRLRPIILLAAAVFLATGRAGIARDKDDVGDEVKLQ